MNIANNPHLHKTAVIGSCCEIATKKRGFIYVDEECGNKAKIEVEYTLNGKLVRKQLCMKHYKSVAAWLDRIKVYYNCLQRFSAWRSCRTQNFIRITNV